MITGFPIAFPPETWLGRPRHFIYYCVRGASSCDVPSTAFRHLIIYRAVVRFGPGGIGFFPRFPVASPSLGSLISLRFFAPTIADPSSDPPPNLAFVVLSFIADRPAYALADEDNLAAPFSPPVASTRFSCPTFIANASISRQSPSSETRRLRTSTLQALVG